MPYCMIKYDSYIISLLYPSSKHGLLTCDGSDQTKVLRETYKSSTADGRVASYILHTKVEDIVDAFKHDHLPELKGIILIIKKRFTLYSLRTIILMFYYNIDCNSMCITNEQFTYFYYMVEAFSRALSLGHYLL